ncbi:MAG: enoyl-CoA hydratase/isomerase family protein [Gammaproteobacteria bacterium]|nr:enoyl-CoA hydratase/isomerase family protein [Gammaproteobacteria bacterium]MXY06534.1 enoyl-CoA hydratase/isomerase family protein [Gammaproteobacteria bacterium]MYE53345.1 enoyl-CoA hydratase/isomerase family protein [Gammaproteobacteria bacterium]MYG11974.1 enoyl-CoA hydratase/isomerase family protein [Gammaproteobacteria bacterium]MYK28133.1 enoyl-CoA hydratase/isomerase family protein [Gammaproteobacteria bacterium]
MVGDGYQTIDWHYRGSVLYLTLNRPESLNSVDATLHAELATVFSDAQADERADVIVLTGSGRAFCAGGNMDWMQDAIDNPENFELTVREAKQIIFSMLDCEKPIIAKVNGAAVGLGCTLALFCDIIFAADDVVISDPHVGVGMVAGDGGAVIWPQLVGYARAKEFLMTGDALTPREAERIGLINHAVPREELDEVVDAFADRLANSAQKAVRWSKVSVNIGLKQLAHSIMDASLAYEALTNVTEDHQEAVHAFREKRKPIFKGR